MNRRSFLQMLGVSSAAIVAPSVFFSEADIASADIGKSPAHAIFVDSIGVRDISYSIMMPNGEMAIKSPSRNIRVTLEWTGQELNAKTGEKSYFIAKNIETGEILVEFSGILMSYNCQFGQTTKFCADIYDVQVKA